MSGDNHYEEIIDKMMLDLIEPKLQEKILGLEHKYQRLAILSLLMIRLVMISMVNELRI